MAYYLYESDKTSFEEFVSLALKDQGIKFKPKELKDLVNPDFDNVLYRDGNEIYFEKVRDSEKPYYYFKINKLPQKIDIRFGCELETCFVLNCATGEAGYEEASQILSKEKWSDGVIYHLRNTIIPSLSEEFKKRFTYAFVKGYHARQGNYVDLRNGNLVSESIASDEYKTLRFEPDASIKCEEVEGQVPYPCEIISPILSSVKEIKLLYEGLMINESCAQSNKSMGFHVNVSAVDENGKMVELTRGMLTELIYGWLPYEKKNYKALRGVGSYYAKKLEDVVNSIDKKKVLDIIVKNKNGGEINNYEYFSPYGLNIWNAYKNVNSEKYYSMTHHKNNNVVEFRVFPSKNDLKLLLSYTQDAINVFKSSLESYVYNPERTLMNLQKTYINYKYDMSFPVKEFSGNYDAMYELLSLISAVKINFIYREKRSFFFFDDISFQYYFGEPGKTEGYRSIIKYKLPGGNIKYYSYDYIYDIKDDEAYISFSNPIEISSEEFKGLQSKFRKSKAYSWWWDDDY
jgi:hypothetical protein